MTMLKLTAVALSPVHVGDGTTWQPEMFRLDGDFLCRFDPQEVVAGLNPQTLQDFLRRLQRPDAAESHLRGAQDTLRRACRPDQVRERIAVSPASREQIKRAIDNPGRSGKVHPFIRSGDRPFLPGSAIKGAIRTALLSEWVKESPQYEHWRAEVLRDERVQQGEASELSNEIQALVLGTIDTDPFRFVRVSDASLPGERTQIEQVKTLKRSKRTPGATGQMHFECILPGTRFEIELDVRDRGGDFVTAARAREAAGARARSSTPARMPSATELLKAVDSFYRQRLSAEQRRFPQMQWQLPPSGRDGLPALIRIGRFSHFESASVEGLRQGWQVQARQAVTEGSTRAVAAARDGFWPFGWVLLFPQDRKAEAEALADKMFGKWPQPSSNRKQASERDAGAPEGTAQMPFRGGLVGRRGWTYGEPVVVLRQDGNKLSVRFLDDDKIETIKKSDFKPKG